MKRSTITGQINKTALRLLSRYPDGLRWSELSLKIEEANPDFHPKTINGCIWKLVERFPDKVHKPSRGVFRLLKDSSAKKDKGK